MEDEAVTVAVAGDELAAVARAVLDGTAVLALAAPR
jgi:hypothetical protein